MPTTSHMRTTTDGPRSVLDLKRPPTAPGEMLLEEFLVPMGVSQRAFAAHLKITTVRLNEIIKGKRGITADTALRLSCALGTSPEFWLNLQIAYDLAASRPQKWVIHRLRVPMAARASRKASPPPPLPPPHG